MKRRFPIYLILISIGVYSNTILNDFVAGDRQFILKNPLLGNFQAVLKSFTSDYWGALSGQSFVYYRPLTVFSHFIDFSLYGLNPAWHHVSNIFLHIIVTLLVYRLFCSLFPQKHWAAFTGAALFALHPIHTHSVSYVVGRTDILAALFYLGSLILLIDLKQGMGSLKNAGKPAGACLLYLLAVLCKEIAITLPIVYLLYKFLWPAQNHRRAGSVWVPFCLLCMTCLFYMLMRFNAVGITVPGAVPQNWYSMWQRIELVFITCGFYALKLCFPLSLCYYSNIVIPETWAGGMLSLFFVSGVICVAALFFLFKKAPRANFAFCWFLFSLLPVLNIIPIPAIAKENYLYLPSIGFCLLLSLLIAEQRGNAQNIVCGTVMFVLGLIYAVGTVKRNNDYKDPVIFLNSTLQAMRPIPADHREDPRYFEGAKNFFTTYRNLGRLYNERGLWDKAAAAFEEALFYTPSYFSGKYDADIRVSLGAAYEKLGRIQKAEKILNEVLPVTSKPYYVCNLLGVIAVKDNKAEKAQDYFQRAISIKRDYAPAHYNLGVLWMKLNMPQKGAAELLKAAGLDPKYRKSLPPSSQGPPLR